jgi:hypothetical protein
VKLLGCMVAVVVSESRLTTVCMISPKSNEVGLDWSIYGFFSVLTLKAQFWCVPLIKGQKWCNVSGFTLVFTATRKRL